MMSIYFSIGPITFDLSAFLSFFLGMMIGFSILLLIYLYAVLKSLNKGLKLRQTDEADIDEEEIKWLIEDAQEQFKDKDKRGSVGFYTYLLELCKELSVDIAKKFYPNSKYPYLELTIDETLVLSHYITNRLDDLLNSKILRLTRGVTLIKIVEMNEVKTNIENTKIMKTAKKYKVNQILKTSFAVVNAVNPVYWGRKLVINNVTNMILMKIGLSVIAITGEETYKIYSKKVFNEEKQIDMGVDDIYKDINIDDLEFEEEANEKKKGK